MAETATTRPRARTAAKTAAKPAPKAPAKPATATQPVPSRITIELENSGETASYDKFKVADELKGTVAGQLYVPKGAIAVKVLIVMADDVEPASE
jgi:hypothetical protein